MIAGKLDRKVTFTRAELIDDGYGNVTGEFAPIGAVWAHRADVSDAEKYSAGLVQASVTTRFTVRSSSFTRAIKPQDRLTCEGLDFDISGIKQVVDRRGQFLEITASARNDGG